MNEQMEKDPSSEEDQPQDAGQPTSTDQPPLGVEPTPSDPPMEKAQPARQFKLTWQFVAGFLGWFLLNGLLWLLISARTDLPLEGGNIQLANGIYVFPLNLVIMSLLLRIKKVRPIGQGILAAFGVNLIISLILGLSFNALCLVPFFTQ